MSRPLDIVIDFLNTQQARGVTHVFLDDAAREGLRNLHRRTRPEPASKQPLSAVTAGSPSATPNLVVAGATKQEQLESLRAQADHWPPAKSLGTLRNTLVFSSRGAEARVIFVTEAPGYDDEKNQEPISGPAGGKLADILKAMGLSRDESYLTHVVKFRPSAARQTTNNRKPSREEITACLPLLHAEVEIIRPTCIVALGQTAAETLLETQGTLPSLRGSWHDFNGIPVRVTYHPSSMLGSVASLTTKRLLWEDMLEVMEKLQLPISSKQRAFFLPKE